MTSAAHLPRAEALAAEFGIPAAYGDYRRLLERADVDIVGLCVPNHLHEPLAIAAAVFLKWEEGLRRDGAPLRVCSVTAEVGDLTRMPSFQQLPEKWVGTGWEDVESWSTLIMTFADGARATIFAADTVLGGIDNTLDIFLANGRIKCDMTHSTLLQAYAPSPRVFADEYLAEKLETKAGWSYPSIDEEWLLGFPWELADFLAAVVEGREPLSTGEFGREVVKVI